MKIEVTIPDWATERHLYILAGIELVAFKHVDKDWKVKISRCSMCGKCCEKLGCEHLNNNKECDYNTARPWSCCIGVSNIEGCTEEFIDVK